MLVLAVVVVVLYQKGLYGFVVEDVCYPFFNVELGDAVGIGVDSMLGIEA